MKKGDKIFIGICFGATIILWGFIIHLVWKSWHYEIRYNPKASGSSAPLIEKVVEKACAEQIPEPAPELFEVTMFTSDPDQTDSTPCLSADNKDICDRWLDRNGVELCASNDFPLGTTIIINEEQAGLEYSVVCTVVDRMNKRFSHRVDVYNGFDEGCLLGKVPKGLKQDLCPQYREALKFGKRSYPVQKIDLTFNK